MRAVDLVVLAPAAWFAVRALRRPAVSRLPAPVGLAVLVLDIEGDDGRRRSVAVHRDTSIGSSPTCGIQVSGAGVDPQHGTIERAGEGWVLTDAGSSTGIWANERPVFGPLVLAPGDDLRIGSVHVRVDQASVPGPRRASVR